MKSQASDNHSLAYILISLVSAVVLAFLFWLIYFKEGADSTGLSWVSSLPTLNAAFNTLTTIFLVLGFIKIKKGRKKEHVTYMLSALTTSALFLVSYILYHHYQGDTKFLTTGWLRPTYFFILITHIVLSIVQVPLIFTTLYHAARNNFKSHKTFARVTFPIWLYVSVTGVLVYIFVNFLNFPPA